MPELNFNLLAPTSELYSGPQVKLDPQAAYDTAQAQQQSNMLSQLYAKHYDPQTGGINYNSLIGEAAQNPLTARAIPKIMEGAQSQAQSMAEIEKNRAAAAKSDLETKITYDENRHKEVNRAISDIAKYGNKADAIAGIERNFEEGKLDQNAYDAVMGMVRAEPVWARSQGKILQSLISEKEQLERSTPTTKERTDGQYKWEVYSNPNLPNYGQEVPKSRIKQQLTPDQAADLALRRQTEERLAKEAEAKTNAPANTSREAALSFLKEAGYDATTDTDDVSSMIPESTSGGLEKKGAEIYGYWTGESTEGQKILGKLESRASKLVINLLGGKLGAGISNPDRDFMTKAVGDIGNADLPADKRLAAWKDLMLRMKAAAGVVPANIAPTVPGGGGAGAGVQPSATNERQTKSGVKYTVRENP